MTELKQRLKNAGLKTTRFFNSNDMQRLDQTTNEAELRRVWSEISDSISATNRANLKINHSNY